MEEKTIIFINEVYIDLLNKSKCNQNILKRVKLINELLKEQYTEEIYVLSRSVYEELMKELVRLFDSQFQADIKTQPGEFRNKVIDNMNILFRKSIIDKQVIKGTYDYLCKTSHESVIKRLICDLTKNEKSKYAIECNTYFVLCTIMYIYLCNLYKDDEISELINKLFIRGMNEIILVTLKFLATVTPDEIEYYNSYFVTSNDYEFLNVKKDELINATYNLENDSAEDESIYDLNDIDTLINKYGYTELYDKIVLNR